ncbi:hypothetical protein [Sinorhizobium meliloti]|uniref:hypothetical protein n=1 Tax=Rhizobium meliloti TaxID=382 RepID=UPI000FDB12C6|nr:hypothetical protein [Sinorhizobium meliloti]MCK3802813.1 hypothetical protein [Sinorhizobium meliloti]MCK3808667.1 hypothetical protein [Sinorhizobium meliloti]MCK3813436.1 hypothetical protein [Sinorhizobium meliloti]RVL48036.1 hypothetical protein CN146_04650 [Sinorhizobium meliloti]RVN21668.1 hypothetical protein CN115_01955 [Sinorhizobium meliloti]
MVRHYRLPTRRATSVLIPSGASPANPQILVLFQRTASLSDDGRICDGEYLAKSIARVNLTDVKANRRSLSANKDLHVEAKAFKFPSNRCLAAAEIRR